MAAITPGRRALHYQWGQQSVLSLRWGDNTLTSNSVNQPSGFWAMGETHKSKSCKCSACMSLCATLGPTPHRKQTLGQMELFIQLYTLFGRCMSFSDWETICCLSWWITDFELSLLFRGWWVISTVFTGHSIVYFFIFFLDEIKGRIHQSRCWL